MVQRPLTEAELVLTPTTPLGDGSYSLRAYATDAAGNASANSSVFTFTVDTAAPACRW